MARKRRQKIGEILIDQKSITKDQLKAAMEAAKGTTKRVGEVLQEQEIGRAHV